MPLPGTIPFIGLTWADALFLMLGGAAIAGALFVVLGRDIIRNGLALIASFGALAGIYVILGAAIVAGAQVLVYIGAISVLILFAVLGVLLALALGATQWGATVFEGTPAPAGTSSTTAALFGPYLLAFEIASVLILAAVIGGIYLATAPKPGDDEGDEVAR